MMYFDIYNQKRINTEDITSRYNNLNHIYYIFIGINYNGSNNIYILLRFEYTLHSDLYTLFTNMLP